MKKYLLIIIAMALILMTGCKDKTSEGTADTNDISGAATEGGVALNITLDAVEVTEDQGYLNVEAEDADQETEPSDVENAVPDQETESSNVEDAAPDQETEPSAMEDAAPDEKTEPVEEPGGATTPMTDTLYSMPSGSAISIDGPLESYFASYDIKEGDPVFNRINGKSYVENRNISISGLKYLKVPYYDFSHRVKIGELIVSSNYADKYIAVFKELFAAGYEINSMRLIDDFWMGNGEDSDTASIDANNTSAFCYRAVADGKKLSKHSLGRAIDINPQQNPYVRVRPDGTLNWDHENANAYIDRTSGDPHVIVKGDICHSAFSKYGFFWGGNWKTTIDYQHFEIQ